MKRTFITLIMTILLGVACFGETLGIEIIEFDCADHPDLYEKYSDAMMPTSSAETGDYLFNSPIYSTVTPTVEFSCSDKEKVLSEIEKVAEKTIVLNHSQDIQIGDEIDQITQFQDSQFHLKALTETIDNGSVNIELDFSLTIGKYKKRSMKTEVSIQRGQAVSMGDFMSTKTIKGENGVEEIVKTVSVIKVKID